MAGKDRRQDMAGKDFDLLKIWREKIRTLTKQRSMQAKQKSSKQAAHASVHDDDDGRR